MDVEQFDSEVQRRVQCMQRKAYELEDRMRTYLGELLARLSHSNKEITISQLLTTLEDVPDSSALRTCLSAIQPRMKLIDQRKGADRTVKDEPEIRRRTSGRVSKRISGLQPQNAPRSNTRRIGSHRVSGIVPSSAKYATDSTTRRRPSIAIHTSSHDEVDPSGTGRKRVRNKKRETIHVSMELEDGNELVLPELASEMEEVKSQMNKAQIAETVEKMKEMQAYFATMVAQLQTSDL